MFRTGFACTAVVLAALTLSACNNDTKSAATTETKASATVAAQTTATTSAAAQPGGTGDACSEVGYEIDLAHQLQQGQEPSDPSAAMLRLSKFRTSAPTEIIAPFAQVNAVIVGHLQKKGEDQINSDAANILLGKLSTWKSAHC